MVDFELGHMSRSAAVPILGFWANLGFGSAADGPVTGCFIGLGGFGHGSLNVPIEHHPTIRFH